MTRKALFLPVLFLALTIQAWAAAEVKIPPQSPVARVFLERLKDLDAAGRKSAGACEDLRRCAGLMSPSQRGSAREGLLKLESGSPAPALLSEIGQGYIALGFPGDVVRLLSGVRDDSLKSSLLSKAAAEYHSQGRLELAMAAAEEALKADPTDEAALAVLRLSERQVRRREISSLPAKPDAPVESGQGTGRAGGFALPGGSSRRSSWPSPPMEVYHLPDTTPPSSWDTIVTGVGSLWKVYWHSPSSAETAAVNDLKKKLASLPTGQELVRQLGGWDRVDKEVYFIVTDMSEDGTAAYVRPMTPWESKKKGKNFVLAINKKVMEAGTESVLPVFGHELSHVADKLKGRTEMDLAVTSEHGAHLQQVYLFQEVEKSLAPERRKEVEKKGIWMYQKWLASMWEDRLLKLYPKKEDYQKVFESNKNLQYLAGLAYEDIYKKAIGDGTPQMLYHVSDLYANATREPELTEESLLKRIKAEPDPARRAGLESLLKKLSEMRKGFLAEDDTYRKRTGQTLP